MDKESSEYTKPTVHDVIEAREFILRDEDGKARARLGKSKAGNPILSIHDAQEKARIQLTVTSDGQTSCRFGVSKKTHVDLMVGKDGNASLNFYGTSEKARLRLGLLDEEPRLFLYDPDGAARVLLLRSDDEDNVAAISFLDGDGEPIVSLGFIRGGESSETRGLFVSEEQRDFTPTALDPKDVTQSQEEAEQ